MCRNGNTRYDTRVAVELLAPRLAEDVFAIDDEVDDRDQGQGAARHEGGVRAQRQLVLLVGVALEGGGGGPAGVKLREHAEEAPRRQRDSRQPRGAVGDGAGPATA